MNPVVMRESDTRERERERAMLALRELQAG
jgi:hypothetical protein